MSTIPPDSFGIQNPAALRLTRAYAPAVGTPAGPAQPVQRVRDTAEWTPAARAAETGPIARLAPAETPGITPDAPAGARKLVAGTVPGSVDFRGETPRVGAGPRVQPGEAREPSLPFYRHPADRNAAATGIDAGRLLDTEA